MARSAKLDVAIANEFKGKYGRCTVRSFVLHGIGYVINYTHEYNSTGNKQVCQYRTMGFNSEFKCKFDCIVD